MDELEEHKIATWRGKISTLGLYISKSRFVLYPTPQLYIGRECNTGLCINFSCPIYGHYVFQYVHLFVRLFICPSTVSG